MISICCTLPKPIFNDLLPDQKKKFCLLVSKYRKKGYIPFLKPKREPKANCGVKRFLLIEFIN
jgi:hypothetical protein